MSDVIEFMDWIDLQKSLNLINEQVSGMTAAEAEAALGALKNSNLYIANTNTTIAGSSVINFPNTTAAEAASEYIAGGGATTASGAAVGATGDVVGTANIAIGQTTIGQIATRVYGLLSMPLPTAAAALAPLAGVAIGAGLYNLNPDLWSKISKALLPFCYDGSELMPVMADSNGNTYFSQEAINALKALQLNDTIVNYPPSQTTGSVTITSVNSNIESFYSFIDEYYPINNIRDYDNIISPFFNNYKDHVIQYSGPLINTSGVTSKETLALVTNLKVDNNYIVGNSYYCPYAIRANIQFKKGEINITDLYTESYQYNATIYYGNLVKNYKPHASTANADNSLSTGINTWNGEKYPDGSTPINILTGYDEHGKPIYTPYYPVSTPIGDPGVSNDPAVNPNPAVNPDPAPVINPIISPVPNPNLYPNTVPVPEPAPAPNPVPEPQPVPEPDVDPSKDNNTKPDKDPTTPKDPTDGGITPTPIIPTIPVLPSAATGLLHVYNPTQSQIDAFGSWLWTTFSGDLIDTLSKLFNDPMDAVIGLHELYATPAVSGGATIRCGYLDSGINANLVGSRYTTINCGSVVVEEYYQNYLDYSPYTSCFIYLPFVGIVPVSSDDIIGNAVNVTYHIDSYTGCCIAVVTVAKEGYSSTVYQFEGNCAVEIPISSGYQSSLMSGLLAVAGTAITSSPTVGMTAAHIGRAGLGKNTVQHSGSFGSSYGAMGNKVPYIIVKRPVQKKVYNYSQYYGYPAHKMVYVGNCENYLRAKEVRVTSTTATNVEKDMIVNLLKSGVYVKGDK